MATTLTTKNRGEKRKKRRKCLGKISALQIFDFQFN